MADAAKKKPAHQAGRVRSSLVARLNTRLFFRLLGIYLSMDLLLLLLCAGGLFFWADRQCSDIAALVEERGVPSAEATVWMEAGDYLVKAGDDTPTGFRVPHWVSVPGEPGSAVRYFDPGSIDLFFFLAFDTGNPTGYSMALSHGDEPYSITLNLERQVTLMVFASRVVAVCQLFSLICNLFKNAGTIRRTLRPIQELAATAVKLNHVSGMSPEELAALAGKLDAINATHLDARIQVSGTQQELRSLAQAINAMLDRINEAYRSQMRFVSDASHELRTPIAVIQGYANLLDRWGKDDPSTRQESIDAIRVEAASMKELVEQLLFLARGDNDSMHLEFTRLDLTELAAQVLKETEMIDQTHLLTGAWDGEVFICADTGLVKQAMRILVDNSIKYTPAGGHITLSVKSAGGEARLAVQDEGQGIEAAAIGHIFDRFYRTDDSRARHTGGTGLGLAIAKWIADRHGGHFEVLSREGVGTRITMVLPLDQSGEEQTG